MRQTAGRSRVLRALLIAMLLLLGLPAPAHAATLPTGFTETIIGGLTRPTAMAIAPDGRLFVAEQAGALRVIKDGALLPTAFRTFTVDARGERGLLGVAVDPTFATNGFVYVYYTTTTPTVHNRVVRLTASGDVAVGGETPIIDLPTLSGATNHNGGALHFGPDGMLYIAVGENATASHAQTLANPFGKILRLNADGSIPTDNPFYTQTSGQNRAIWALGLRNPFTFAFQPGTGRMFINDVGSTGANVREEINEGVAKANYGWPNVEGIAAMPLYRDPIYAYPHSGGPVTGCAITGGAFYNPPVAAFPPAYVGDYFFADFCGNWIKRLDPASGIVSDFATDITAPVDLQVGADGSLYYLAGANTSAGVVGTITFTGSAAPAVTTHPVSQTITVGRPVTFTVAASGTAPLSYQWQRNGADIPGATSASYTIPAVALGDTGAQFRCHVTNAAGNVISNAATLTVTANQAPTATITAPAAGTRYSGGEHITYSGAGSDPESGPLGGAAMTWWVDFHHDDHAHPFIAPASGATGGSFVIPTAGEISANVWYRINLRVTDPDGLTATTFRDLLPRTATLTLTTSPTGLALTLDGQPQPTPTQIASVVGVTRTLGTTTQTIGGVTYAFAGWSDGGGATHDIATPASDTTYTAAFRVAGVAAPAAMTWWFAEGYTGPGFDEYLTILNANAGPAAVALTYYLNDGTTIEKALTVAGNARTTVAVHEDTLGVGRGKEVAARVTTTNPGGIVVERPIYFRYAGGAGVDITGGHTALGATAPRAQWWFAEGYTGAGFDQYLAILNPGAAPAPVTLTYYLGSGQATSTKQVTVAPRSRATIAVHDDTLGVGRNQAVAVRVATASPDGIVVERPMYFRYTGSMGTVTGGHNALGAAGPAATWWFAEGYTGTGFDEYLTILNPHAAAALVTLTYYVGGVPDPITRTLTVPATARATVAVHDATLGVGRDKEVAVRVTTSHAGGIVAERPTYFLYGNQIDGGHDAMGAAAPKLLWYVAEGYTGPGFDEYLTILNPNPTPAGLLITYFLPGGATVDRALTVPAESRTTVAVHDPAAGVGRDRDVAARIVTTNPAGVVVERPVYFRYGAGITGGHTTAGFAP